MPSTYLINVSKKWRFVDMIMIVLDFLYMFNPTLTSTLYRLESLKDDHFEGLQRAASHADIWSYVRPSKTPLNEFILSYLKDRFEAHQSNNAFTYTAKRNDTNNIVGSTSYYDISKENNRLAIGFTWYHPDYWACGLNVELKFLLLSQVFETLCWNRAEFHIDSRNSRSLSAMTYLGAQKEGVLRRHKLTQGDFMRDTVVMSILREEWPQVKEKLLRRMPKGYLKII
jgi:RimJ/RimL family protein N-acetyltransferase